MICLLCGRGFRRAYITYTICVTPVEREETVEVRKENEGREYKNVTEGKRAPTKSDDESQPD